LSLYQLHRAVWDQLRAGEVSSGPGRAFDVTRYDLTEPERRALEDRDMASLYQLGLHPVLLNGYARANGFSRDGYREVLQVFAGPETRKARWQK